MENCCRKILIMLVATCSFFELRAARYVPPIEQLPAVAVDTISTPDPDTKVILYSNNTWSYYRAEIAQRLDTLDVYSKNWGTTSLFAYKEVQISDIPDVIEINLIKDISEFHVPKQGSVISKYSWRKGRMHKGVDIPVKVGDPIYATFDGKIRIANYNTGGYGFFVIIRHHNGLETWHGHMCKLNVKSGDYVKAGQVIGFGGSTGRSTGPHLHYEIRYCDMTFDPEYLIDFENGELRYMTFSLEKSFLNSLSRASELLDEDDSFKMPDIDGSDSVSEDILSVIDKEKEIEQAAKRAVYHVIKSGDMLGRLAIKYGVSIDQICRLNNMNRNTVLKLGRKIRIK